ncbi:hypothetical protein [Anaerospora hongkongensis]|uniref:hypothetical protein n=1 Tax=Anaerospora hongkongensis TaxID=244830 RepID=UPI0028992AB1|nr:hypothetical protein [Anaerospora hongkongensis]
MLYWWPIAKHLSDYLASLPEFADWSVYPGSKGSSKKYPCCEVQWDQEAGLSVNKSNKGNITLWLDLWVRSDDVDPSEVYQRQHDAQVLILGIMRNWSDRLLHDMRVTVAVSCPGIASAGTITRPSFGCRIILDIEWRNSRHEQ